MKIFLMGYRKIDFSDKQDPNRRITGTSLYLASESDGVVGVLPVSNDGKRFLNSAAAKKLGITYKWLDDHIGGFVDIDIDFDGKIVDISEYAGDDSDPADDRPF